MMVRDTDTSFPGPAFYVANTCLRSRCKEVLKTKMTFFNFDQFHIRYNEYVRIYSFVNCL